MAEPAAAAPAPAQASAPAARDEVQFFRQLQAVTNRIHGADNIEQLMLEVSGEICELFQADQMTIYAVREDGHSIVSRVKTGLQTVREIRLPINGQSIAGFVAMQRVLINIADVRDEAALKRISPKLSFQKEVDRRSGYRTQQLLTSPVVDGDMLHGVVQIINTRSGEPFNEIDEDGVRELCKTLAIAFRQRKRPLESGSPLLGSPLAGASVAAAPVPLGAFPAAGALRSARSRYHGLVDRGAISERALDTCLADARSLGLSQEDALLQVGLKPEQIGQALGDFFGVPYEGYRDGRLRIDGLHGVLKRDFVLEQRWLPIDEGTQGLTVMCLDPEAVQSSKVVRQVFPRAGRVQYVVTTQKDFFRTVDQIYALGDGHSIDQMLADLKEGEEPEPTDDAVLASAASDNELVKLVNKIIVDAHQQGASDIHIEPEAGKGKTAIRFRVDGTLRPYIEVPAAFRSALVTRLKIMCDLDIAERRKPQDGKIKFKRFGPLDIELRVATLPSAGGVEDVVMRLLAAGEPIPMDKLGLTPHNRERLVPVIEKPYGLFYVCGPTGSGKTTTLHSILNHLNRPDTKIWTAEDPVEITQKGLRQIQINKKAGIDFALVMRAFLRADPDIIMVGESRDHETVSMGVEASLTGHLVFSTLHTNSAPESIVRLLDMGMDPFNFADALLGILAQRLVKRLCECKQPRELAGDELQACAREYAQDLLQTSAWQADPDAASAALIERWTRTHAGPDGRLRLYEPVGCDKCGKSGYKGRLGLHELLVADNETKRLIQERARVQLLLGACLEQGMHTLKMDGMEKALMGLTDLKQVRQACVK